MGKYKFEIKKEDKGYFFILYPNNNNKQEVGRSIYYSVRDKCEKALEEFKSFVTINKIDNYKSEFIKINQNNDKWFYEYIKDDKTIFYRYRGYKDKANAIKIIGSIYLNIDVN